MNNTNWFYLKHYILYSVFTSGSPDVISLCGHNLALDVYQHKVAYQQTRWIDEATTNSKLIRLYIFQEDELCEICSLLALEYV